MGERNFPSALRIDRDDLDGCLISQPELYYRVAEAFVRAVAERDAAKLRLEEAVAEMDKETRTAAEREDKKITESRIDQEIKLRPRYRELRARLADATTQADAAQALKEAYQQRSFMLRELVALVIAERSDQAGARGSYEMQGRRVEAAVAARTEALRRERERGGGRD